MATSGRGQAMPLKPRVSEWRRLPLSLTELCIDTTLRCGQSFRWLKLEDEWHCALKGRVISLKQDATHLHYKVTWPDLAVKSPRQAHRARETTLVGPASRVQASNGASKEEEHLKREEDIKDNPHRPEEGEDDDTEVLLRNYFNLSTSLVDLYKTWSARDPNFARRSVPFYGVRILAQDPWEALVSFICSSNNNIARISGMVDRLCLRYGAPLAVVRGRLFYDFPSAVALASSQDDVEAVLRDLGFGYRARYLAAAARLVACERPPGWLSGLRSPISLNGSSTMAFEDVAAVAEKDITDLVKRENEHGSQEVGVGVGVGVGEGEDEGRSNPSYEAARDALLEIPGVGPKVADCVCLMGLGWAEAVPVDTHVWQIAKRDYKFGKGSGAAGAAGAGKTFGRAVYDAVGGHFREIWGSHAGWAQSVLFTANLKSFAEQAAEGPARVVEVEKRQVLTVGKGAAGQGKEEQQVSESTPAVRNQRKRKAVTEEISVHAETMSEKGKTMVHVRKTRLRSSTRAKRGPAG